MNIKPKPKQSKINKQVLQGTNAHNFSGYFSNFCALIIYLQNITLKLQYLRNRPRLAKSRVHQEYTRLFMGLPNGNLFPRSMRFPRTVPAVRAKCRSSVSNMEGHFRLFAQWLAVLWSAPLNGDGFFSCALSRQVSEPELVLSSLSLPPSDGSPSFSLSLLQERCGAAAQ